MLSLQDAFNQALTHVRAQGKPATKPGSDQCLYRTETNLKCAIGALIPDDKYDPDMEQLSAYHAEIIDTLNLAPDVPHGSIAQMQTYLHDGPALFPNEFLTRVEAGARDFARRYNLTMPTPTPEHTA